MLRTQSDAVTVAVKVWFMRGMKHSREAPGTVPPNHIFIKQSDALNILITLDKPLMAEYRILTSLMLPWSCYVNVS